MGATKIVVDLYTRAYCYQQILMNIHRYAIHIPCNVRVMDCSNFSSSSVRLSVRCEETLGRDMILSSPLAHHTRDVKYQKHMITDWEKLGKSWNEYVRKSVFYKIGKVIFTFSYS